MCFCRNFWRKSLTKIQRGYKSNGNFEHKNEQNKKQNTLSTFKCFCLRTTSAEAQGTAVAFVNEKCCYLHDLYDILVEAFHAFRCVSFRRFDAFRCVSMRFDAFHLFCLFVSFGGLGGVLVLGVSNSLEFGVCEVNILQVVEVVPVLRVKHQNKLWLGQLFNFPRLHLRSNRGLIVSFDPKVFEVKIQRLDIFIFLFFFFRNTFGPFKSLVCGKFWICWDSCRYEIWVTLSVQRV